MPSSASISPIGALPSSVSVHGIDYPIRTSFRIGLQFEELMADHDVPDGTKLALALNLYYTDTPPDTEAAIERMLWFHRCGQREVEGDGSQRLYSFTHDFPLLFSGFLAAYGIDLYDDSLSLHWWRFRAMMTALPKESEFVRAIGYRAQKPHNGMSAEERRHLSKMKRLYALPIEEVPALSEADIIRAKFGDEAAERWLASTR